jgi:hypothetical protein
MDNADRIWSLDEMRCNYGTFFDTSPRVRLEKSHVPEMLWPLMHYAEFWGIADDVSRETLILKAPLTVRENLKYVVDIFDELLTDWLAGPDADDPNPTDEYVAFSAMRMAADFV